MSLIVVEGIDSVGKKTQCRRLSNEISAIEAEKGVFVDGVLRRKSVSSFDFPHYDSLSGPYLKALLSDSVTLGHQVNPPTVDLKKMKAVLLQALMSMNRYEYSKMLDENYFNKDKILVLDRYFASALAYGPEDGLPEDVLLSIHSKLEPPDLSILIDLPAEESMRRRPIREDAYEADVEFLARVRTRYINIFNELGPRVYGETWIIVDGMGSEDEVSDRIISVYKTWSGDDRRPAWKRGRDE